MSRVQSPPPDIPGFSYLEPLGSGGYSDVYLYEQQHPKMKVAVKVLTGEDLTESDRRQLMAEANAMAELADHPSIVQVFSADVTADGRPYLVMKYYPNKSMSVRAQEERLGVAEVLRIGIQISDAVETAHRAGILHRDIKPANILTGQYGAIGLTDFGIAATKGAENTDDSGGMSVPWAPPEVIFSTSPADERSDVYSLGATVWHLLVGRSPFVVPGGDNTQWALMRRIQETPPPRTGRDDVPDSLERLLQQAMAKDPARRPQSALGLARALQAVEQEQRFAVTPILVDQIDRRTRVPVADDDGNETRRRPLQRVDAQTPPPPKRTPPVFVSDDDETRRSAAPVAGTDPSGIAPRVPRPREFGPAAPELDGTIVRAPAPSDEPATPAGAQARRRGRIAAIAAVVVLAAAAAVVGVVMTSSPKSPNAAPRESATPNDGLNQNLVNTLEQPAPGTPDVSVSRKDASSVEFSWTYANKADGDSYRWRFASGASGSPDAGVVTTPSLAVSAEAGHAKCLEVQVVRSDGSHASDWSSPVCSS